MSNEALYKRDYKIEDVPWFFHAMTIQLNTTLMYGQEGAQTRIRLRAEVDAIKAEHPALCSYDIEEYVWFDCVQAVRTCKTYSVTQIAHYKTDWSRSDRPKSLQTDFTHQEPIVVTVDSIKFVITRRRVYNEDYLEKIKDYLKQIAALDSVYQDMDQKDE